MSYTLPGETLAPDTFTNNTRRFQRDEHKHNAQKGCLDAMTTVVAFCFVPRLVLMGMFGKFLEEFSEFGAFTPVLLAKVEKYAVIISRYHTARFNISIPDCQIAAPPNQGSMQVSCRMFGVSHPGYRGLQS